MAGLQYRGGSYRVLFRYHGKQFSFTVGEVSEREAQAKASQVDYLLMRIRQRLAVVPPGVDIVEFVQFDGRPRPADTPAAPTTLAELRDRYLATHESSLEATTVYGIRLHFKQLVAVLGEQFPMQELSLADLQRYVDRRSKAKGLNGRKLSPATVKKEIVTLRTAWNWAVKMKLLSGRFPYDGLRYPKSTEKPAFMTRSEIERRIAVGGLTKAEIAELWDALYLTAGEINELLTHTKQHAAHSFIYPMICVAAHTGARRSEIIRLSVGDVDLTGLALTIRERKRAKGRETTRRVPLSPFLATVLRDWLSRHPGGPWLFCHAETVHRSKKRSGKTGYAIGKKRPTTQHGRVAAVQVRAVRPIEPLTAHEATDHFNRTLAGSKWAVLRGWHVCRHSFVGVCATKGIDQRFIDEWVGHQTDQQRRRYRHLAPDSQQAAIASAFSA